MPSREAAAEPGQRVGAHGLGQSSEGWLSCELAAWGSLVLKELGPLSWQNLLCFCFPVAHLNKGSEVALGLMPSEAARGKLHCC